MEFIVKGDNAMSLSIMGGTTHQYFSILLAMISIQFLIDTLYNTLYDTLATYQKSKSKTTHICYHFKT